MRSLAVLFSILVLSAAIFAQEPTPTASPADPSSDPDADKSAFQSAVAKTDAESREIALLSFTEKYPESELIAPAKEYVTAARAERAAKAIENGNNEEGVRLFKLAVEESPQPVSEKLFTGVLLQIPNSLFFSDLRQPALDLASLIESKVADDPKKLLGVATFHLAVENSFDAKRLAEMAIALDPELPAAYQTLGLANRLGFELIASEKAYAKALELDPDSNVSRRSLAEIKRALGKPAEAVELYDQIIASDPSDANAGTGRTLALFDSGRLEQAESSMELLLSINPKNMVLLAGAAYWYAANEEPEKAVVYANRALAVEPRYTWSHIALGHGLLLINKPLDAEKVLLAGRRFGNFPTLNYQIATARLNAGFYREAVEALASSFSFVDGKVKTRLGGRIEKSSDSFTELLAPERKASIFQPATAENAADAERLKRLIRFSTLLESGNAEEAVSEAAEAFVEGSDPMRTHRLIYVATRLLEKDIAPAKAAELAQRAVGSVDQSLDVSAPAAAVLADELYLRRRSAFAQGSTIVVPEIDRQTLSKILRGRIEEIDGWASFRQGDAEDALVHLKRAVSILPAGSAWLRAVHWKMGTVFESLEKDSDALENYLTSYRGGEPNEDRMAVIERVYAKIYGNTQGLEARLSGEEVRTEAASLFLKDPPKSEVVPESTVEDSPAEETDSIGSETRDETDGKRTPASTEESRPAPEATTDDEDLSRRTDRPADTKVADGERSSSDSDASPKLEDIEKAETPTTNETVDGSLPAKAAEVDASKVEEPNAKEDSNRPSDDRTTSGAPPEASNPKAPDEEVRVTTRPRIVPGGNEKPVDGEGETNASCTVALSQDSVSIEAGGSTGVLAGLVGVTGAFTLRAISSSPEDVRVVVDRSLEDLVGRAMFLISSTSSNAGTYSVTFEASCGSKELQVTVR
ncbi:MAG: hypothetical protein DWQ47_00900 [Acidobacteria bacterium]|mgnify:CR=1 FL=1|nr:MAG: hypothetical protein DWQ32_11360 [Acidobacteriota bacterium]REK04063.1 MAG: hypothetical protein DWQ38_00885 [Acidobacteriota bacterium]REK15225.1 MAG: hypothetical protein DWQ43_17050 [Acidobacteriota bacterium]REK46315.1 MAG: hypothetical protein DWQ47_00900 [Acidobacteriota bacterium]